MVGPSSFFTWRSLMRCFAIHRTMRIFVEQETGMAYTIFSDSTATIERAKTDRCEPGQALARAVRGADE